MEVSAFLQVEAVEWQFQLLFEVAQRFDHSFVFYVRVEFHSLQYPLL